MSSDTGFYNKYLSFNNSYLKSYIVRKTVRQNGNCKNINKLIDRAINEIPIFKIKKKAHTKRVQFKKLELTDTSINTETLSKNSVGINTSPPKKNKSYEGIKFNSNSSSANIYNRIILNKQT